MTDTDAATAAPTGPEPASDRDGWTGRARDATDRSWRTAVALLRTADVDDLARPTRCDGWRVADLVTHQLWGCSMEAEALERAAAGDATAAAGETSEVDDPAVAADRLDRQRERLLRAYDRVVAVAGAGTDPLVPLAAATLPFSLVRSILAMEAGVHADDLRQALSGRSSLDDDVVRATADFVVPYLPIVAAGADERPQGPLLLRLRGDAVRATYRFDGDGWTLAPPGAHDDRHHHVVEVGGDDEALALLLLGRTPVDDPRLRWVGTDRPDAVKRWLPGP